MGLRRRECAGGLACVGLLLLFAPPSTGAPAFGEHERLALGSEAQRLALFEEVVAKTLAREQFSPPKSRRLGLDFARDAAALRDAFAEAASEHELYFALVRLSNLRKDRHLRLESVPAGLTGGRPSEWRAPVRFDVHHGEPRFLFVSDVGVDFAGGLPDRDRPRFGDRLVGVGGLDFADYFERAEPYVRYSTRAGLWVALANDLTRTQPAEVPAELEGERLDLELERADGVRYRFVAPYLPREEIRWSGWSRNQRYPGYRAILETPSFVLYRGEAQRRVLLLQWRGFGASLRADLARLVDHAAEHGLLDHDVICDLTRSRGGKLGWLLLQHLSARPFRVILSDIRISDVTPLLIERAPGLLLSDPRKSPMRAYTAAVPQALRAHHDARDGMLAPAPRHFTGRLVAFFGPESGSEVDQLAAMFIDNGLGHSIGMPPAGYSNSFEWQETLTLPSTDLPLVDFRWSVGRTLRPNGQVLEGNPAVPRELVPFTREGYRGRYADLLARAHAHLLGEDHP